MPPCYVYVLCTNKYTHSPSNMQPMAQHPARVLLGSLLLTLGQGFSVLWMSSALMSAWSKTPAKVRGRREIKEEGEGGTCLIQIDQHIGEEYGMLEKNTENV